MRQSRLLLNFFKVRVIINGHSIYQLEKDNPLIIPLQAGRPQIVVSNGFHITRCYEVTCQQLHTYIIKVDCAIDDNLIVAGFVLMALLYAAGLTSDILVLKMLSFLPIIYFLYEYYLNRKDFIQLRLANFI
ncbi:MAG TPA: hypothetical protein VEY32_11955 [Flavisolibacter sp.]|nr:hypothetical protein [Flavisolibacter sp.]